MDTQQDWVDLAGRTAGEAPRQQAEVLRSAAPVRTLVARAFRVKTEERSWRIGAKGEAKVGRLLADLTGGDPRWRVIHSVPVGTAGSDIDHVAIGPGGIFTLNTKNHPDAKVWVAGDTFMVNGQWHPYVRNSRHEARRAAKLLGAVAGVPVSVTGVIVVMGAKSVTVRELPPDVRIVERRQLLPWLRAQPEWLPLAGIDHLYGIARRSTTWVL
ncbi:MAG TPA: nuclease-related domain-containing protein [Actinomycetota bacterium]|nr:nuclease-related domain-containing protein [Actinomycetota bacterium]